MLINAEGQSVGAESMAPGRIVGGFGLLRDRAQVAYAQLSGINLPTAAGQYAEETFEPFSAPCLTELLIYASVRAERYFGWAQGFKRLLYFDVERYELGCVVGSTVLTQLGTFGTLLKVAVEGVGWNLILSARAGAAALLQAERAFVARLNDDLSDLQSSLSNVEVQQA